MLTQDDWLRLVLESPDDNQVRLGYADWLETHGPASRGRYIRRAIAGGPRSEGPGPWASWNDAFAKSLGYQNARWAKSVGRVRWEWARGFIHRIELVAVNAPTLLPRAFAVAPIEQIDFRWSRFFVQINREQWSQYRLDGRRRTEGWEWRATLIGTPGDDAAPPDEERRFDSREALVAEIAPWVVSVANTYPIIAPEALWNAP